MCSGSQDVRLFVCRAVLSSEIGPTSTNCRFIHFLKLQLCSLFLLSLPASRRSASQVEDSCHLGFPAGVNEMLLRYKEVRILMGFCRLLAARSNQQIACRQPLGCSRCFCEDLDVDGGGKVVLDQAFPRCVRVTLIPTCSTLLAGYMMLHVNVLWTV